MRLSRVLLLVAFASFAFAITGCEGDEGPEGPAGPPGPPGTLSEFSYIGKAGQPCLHCHAGTVATWETTAHMSATVFPKDVTDPYCMQCHTTGWDSPVEFGGAIDPANRGPDDEGYDDYFGVDTAAAAARRADLEGVQCEACHGPAGGDFPAHRPKVSFSTQFEGVGEDRTSTSLCWPCHETQLEEWDTSGHAFFGEGGVRLSVEEFNEEHYVNNPSCEGCHTSEGFAARFDPKLANYEFEPEQNFIGCPTCHDPHVGEELSGNPSQLRAIGDVEVEYHPGLDPGEEDVPAMRDKGAGQTCAQCHHARRDATNVAGQIANGSNHFGPHGSPQMDMYIGYGSYEIPGFDYEYAVDRVTTHNGISNACVTCHMVISDAPAPHRVHSFQPSVEACQGCHPGATDFDIAVGGGDGRQTVTQQLMDELAVALGFTDAADYFANFDSRAVGVEDWEREAAYAMAFVDNDGSMGVHNPFYSEELLQNAIDHANANKMALGR